jgi:glucose/arabinose dehydrogenase
MVKRIVTLSLLLLCLAWGMVTAQDDPENPKYKVEQVNDRPLPTGIVWASDHRMFWTEKDGIVGTMSPDGTIQEDPVVQVTVWGVNEDGLISIALDPGFDDNHHFYIFYTAPTSVDNPTLADMLVRYTYSEENGIGVGKDPLRLMRLEITNDFNEHNGGRIKFGQDGYMYLSIGDMGDKSQPQDFNKVGGKIHRFSVSGDSLVPAPGNPFIGNSAWALGVRNTFEFDFDPMGGLFGTENGPDCDDEINRLLPGKNYGWTADLTCDQPIAIRQASGLKPFVSWTPTIAPTGIIYYTGEAFPGWQNQVFYCSWKVAQLRHYKLNADHTAFDGDSVQVDTPPDAHCTVELAQSPEGYIYYSDILGIFRIVPA